MKHWKVFRVNFKINESRQLIETKHVILNILIFQNFIDHINDNSSSLFDDVKLEKKCSVITFA